MSAATIFAASGMMMSRKRILQQLRDLHAFEPGSAAPLEPPTGFDRDVLKSLVKKGVVVAAEPARYYLDREAQQRLEHSEARQVRVLMIAIPVICAIVLAIHLLQG